MPSGSETHMQMSIRTGARLLFLVYLQLSVYTVLEAKPTMSLGPLLEDSRRLETSLQRINAQEEEEGKESAASVHSKLFSLEDGTDFARKVRGRSVVALVKGCGREPNRLAVLDDGTKACCRYRDWEWREVRGEFYSYHFNNLLGLHNAPPAILVWVNYTSPQWAGVADSLREAKWRDRKIIVMTLFVEEIIPEAIPMPFRRDSLVVGQEDVMASDDRERLLQWSDMIVFDYIIGHSDRIFNTLLNLQWYLKMMDRNVHNLWKTKKSKQFLLIDNESGFWMGYKVGWEDKQKLEMQSRFLQKLCIYRTRTSLKIRNLIHDGGDSPRSKLEAYIKSMDPQSFAMLKKLSKKEGNEFESRLKEVQNQIKKCAAL